MALAQAPFFAEIDRRAQAPPRAPGRHRVIRSPAPNSNPNDMSTPVSWTRIPARTNLAIASLVVAVNAAVLLVLPWANAPTAILVAAVAVAALGTPTHWSLIHEAIHGILLPARPANDRLARLLAILFGVPFRAVRFAHLRHHRYNRTPSGREEVYDPAQQSPLVAHALHYGRITFGLYLGEIALSLLCWLPASLLRPRLHALCPDLEDGTRGMAPFVDREILTRQGLAQIRIDAVCLVALYGGAFWLYGRHWPILLALLVVRGFISSQLDHAPHHATPLERRDHALNMTAPRWLECVLLNFNHHRTHHQHPNLPWSALPARSRPDEGDISFTRAVARQWTGPIALPRARDIR